MADADEAPQPSESLEQRPNGDLVVREYDEAGNVVSERDVSSEEALRYLNQLVSLYGTDNVPLARSSSSTFTEEQLRTEFLYVIDRIWRNLAGDDTSKARELARILAAIVTAPEAMELLASPALPRAYLLQVWPDFDERVVTVVEGEELGDTVPLGLAKETFTSDRAILGSERTGPGGLPVSATPPGPSTVAGSGAGPGTASGGSVPDTARAGDPVLPFSGQFLVEVTDLEIPGIGIDLEFRRTYLHSVRFAGPFGPRWDHSYNLWLREAIEPTVGGGYAYAVYQSTGALRAERFSAPVDTQDIATGDIADMVFVPPDGVSSRLEKRAGRFVLSASGREIWYDENLVAERLRDGFGNEIRLIYAADDPRRLVEIIDTCGRRLRLDYKDGRLSHLVDTALGRHIWYGYDEGGRLQSVQKSVDDAGAVLLVAGYRYWGDGAPVGLEHNMLALIDGRGVEVLQVRYGEEPGLISFDRVVEQRDGGITLFDYEFVTDADTDDRVNAPAVRVRMTLPGGDIHLLEYSSVGRLVRLLIVDGNSLAPREFETRWQYNVDGAVVGEERADGSRTAYYHGRELFEAAGAGDPSAEERAGFGHLRRIVEYARPGASTPPTRITEFAYDPAFGAVREIRGPVYGDLLGNPVGGAPPPWRRRYGYDARGNLSEVRAPNCTLPDGTTQAGSLIVLTRDARGRTTRREQPLGGGASLATECSYKDDNAPFPSVEYLDADGLRLELRYTHDAAGRTTEARDTNGLRSVVTFDHLGRTTREEEWAPERAAPATTLYDWGPLALPLRVRHNRVNAQGIEEPAAELTEEFTFDLEGDVETSRLRSADGTLDRMTRVQRDADRRLSSATLDGVSQHSRYEARGRITEMWTSAGTLTTQRRRFFYDTAGRLERTVDARGSETEYEYDGFGRLEVTRRGGTTERCEWDARDHLVRRRVFGGYPGVVGDAELSEETREYDEAGRLVRRRDAVFDPANPMPRAVATTTITYDRADRLVKATGPDGVSRQLRYDGISRVIEAVDGVGTVTTYSYDDATRGETEVTTLSGTDSTGAPVSYRLERRRRVDSAGRVLEEVDALGNTTRAQYDSRGSLTAATDANGIRVERSCWPDDSARRVTTAVGTPAEWSLSYERDAARRTWQVLSPRGPILTLGFDAFNRIERVATGSTAASETVRIERDEEGLVSAMTDASGARTTFDRDFRGAVREVKIGTPTPGVPSARTGATSTVRYEMDGAGRLVGATDGLRPVTRRYDSRGQLLEETSNGATVRWSYDIGGRQTSFEFPNGRRIEYQRLADGRLQRVIDRVGANPPAELLRVWPLGPVMFSTQRWRERLLRTETADPAGRFSALDERRVVDGVSAFKVQQLADASGGTRVRRITVGGVGETLTADTDPHGRVVRIAFEPGAAVPTDPVATQGDIDQQIASVTAAFPANAEEIRLELDADGARRSYARRVGAAVVEQRLCSVDAVGRSVEAGRPRADDVDGLPMSIGADTFTYDAWRRLVRVVRGGVQRTAVEYDALGRIAQVTTPAGAADLVFAGSQLVESRPTGAPTWQFVRLPAGPLVEAGTPAARLRAFVDGQGSLVGLSDGTNVVARRNWDPFGELRSSAGNWPVTNGFHGLIGASDLDLLLSPVRTYDPRGGAFFEPDPLGFPNGSNRRIYAAGSPLAFSDPTGLMAQPAKQSGGPRSEGLQYAFGHGNYSPEDNAFWRAALAMGGALTSFAHGILDTGLMVVDLVGLMLDIGAYGKLDYRMKSGIGQAAADGKIGTGLDVFRVMGKSLIETPGRVLAAAEHGDYGTFGAEALNLAMLARSAPRAVIGTAEVAGNQMVRGLGLFGEWGLRHRARIRTWQLDRMQRTASRLAGIDERIHGRPRLQYVDRIPTRPGDVIVADFLPGTNEVIRISEAAFRPFGRVGWYQGPLGEWKARWEVGNLLRGNYTLRVLTHENFHRSQALFYNSDYMRFRGVVYPFDAREFIQPGAMPPWAIGAWDFEMTVPAGPIATAVGLLAGLEQAATQ
jgi:RHS repeat-associated protein